MRERKPQVRAALERDRKLTDQIEKDLSGAIAEFKAHFR
jgi:hypothetical protein